MRAIIFQTYGGPEVLEMADWPKPEPAPGEVLIAVHAAGVNPADGKWRSGMFASMAPVPLPHILGYDVAGTIEKGDGFVKGTRVVAMLDPVTKGGYAEYVCVKAAQVAAIPETMPFEVAAAIPTASLTGLQLIYRFLNIQPGQRVLITGALGAVGRAALWAARGRSAHVIAAVRAAKFEEALAKGAIEAAVFGEAWSGEPFDAVLDTLGGEGLVPLARHLKASGRIATVATTPIPTEGLAVVPEFYGVQPDGADLARLVAAAASGALAVEIARIMPLSLAAEAQAAVENGSTGGKIILAV